MNITSMFRNVRGEYEPIRVVGVLGGFAFIIGGHAFAGWKLYSTGEFDLIAYCTAYPAGLAAIIGAIAGSLKVKDKATEEARVIAEEHP